MVKHSKVWTFNKTNWWVLIKDGIIIILVLASFGPIIINNKIDNKKLTLPLIIFI